MYDISKESILLGSIKKKSSLGKISGFWLGLQSYDEIWDLQRKIHQQVVDGTIGDILLLLEHPHIYTLGKTADSNHLLPSYPKDADVIDID